MNWTLGMLSSPLTMKVTGDPCPVETPFPEDRPWNRAHVNQITQEDLANWLEGIRFRRLVLVHEYNRVQTMVKEARSDELRDMINKQLRMLDKDFTTLNKTIERIEKRILRCEAAKLELGEY